MRRVVRFALALLLPALAEAKVKKPKVVLIDIPPDATFSGNVTETLNDLGAALL